MFREVTPQQHPFSRGARPTITAVIACIALLLVLSSWNLAVSEWQNRHNPVPGELYSVEGRQMHLYCTGSGSPTVVIEAGVGSDWLGWQVVQPRLSHMTQVCTYDRSGLGWSKPRSGVRDAEAIARELHELLATAGVKPPYVLAGHSGGGFYVREYAREFPAEVVGVVLVDSTSPQQIDELPGFRASYEEDKRNFKKDLWEDRLGVWSGWDRLMGSCHGNPGRSLESLAAYYDAKECRPGFVDTDFAEYRDFELSAREASRLTTFGEIPLLILSRDPNQPGQRSSPTAVASRAIWDREQEALKSLSPMSWRVIAQGSGHKIFQDRAELVLAEMTRLVDFVRGGTPPPFGTTTTQ